MLQQGISEHWADLRLWVATAAAMLVVFLANEFRRAKQNSRDAKQLHESQIKEKISDAIQIEERRIKELTEKLDDANEREAAKDIQIRITRELLDRTEEKADRVFQTNANLTGRVDVILRSLGDGCPKCGYKWFKEQHDER